MRRGVPCLLLPLAFLGTACPNTFDDEPEAIIGSWELEDVDGLMGCTLTGGELEIAAGTVADTYVGDFEWMATCDAGDDIDEMASLTSLDVESSSFEYSLELLRTTPSELMLDWECSLMEPELNCIESGPNGVLVFEFRREGG